MKPKLRRIRPASQGRELFEWVMTLTGLPSREIEPVLFRELAARGKSVDELDIDELRDLVLAYLDQTQEMLNLSPLDSESFSDTII